MKAYKKGVILVGHGAAAKDCPRELVTRLKALEAQRQRTGEGPSQEEIELDTRVRRWPRTPQNDPYKAGLQALADHLRPMLNGLLLEVAYNEFCTPTLEEVVERFIEGDVRQIFVIPSMMTPGGVHSEVEIPAILKRLQVHYPAVQFRYLWPFDLASVARLLSEHLDGAR
jgi:sirohydrochlorin cobaltochelatase